MPTPLPDPRTSPRFAGLVTFGRYPRFEDTTEPIDWAIFGVPYDTGVTYRPGARFGPRAIREQSQYLKRYSLAHEIDICDALTMADAGDAPVHPYHPKRTLDAVCEFAADLGSAETRTLALGGDHSIAYANIKATWIRQGKPSEGLPLIHFDSHLDTVDTIWDERYTHASPFIRLIEEGVIDPARTLTVGIKGPLNTADDLDYGRKRGIEVLTYDRWRDEGEAPITEFVRRLQGESTYCTFDIDCVDPVYAPGTGTPSVGGFTSAEALGLVRAMRGAHLIGADVVEVLPDRDVAGNTALLAAHIAFELLCIDALHRRGG